MVILIVVVLLALAYFRVNIRNIISSEVWTDNWKFISEFAVAVWTNYLEVPITYLWGKIF